MRKILSALLCLSLLLSLPLPVFAADAEAAALPAVGETVEGFTLKEIRGFPLVGAEVLLFEHDHTGAELMYVANDDTNRLFDLTFFTRAIDNTGLPHVFEHATLNGSEKYPSSDLFFNLSYQTYNTYMNAATMPLITYYPVASLSEAQLLKYADFYTDSCLHPNIMTDESIFHEEAWRYRMADWEDELTIEGTVYSEMLGAMNLDQTAWINLLREAFPGSLIGNESGGDPKYIPDMTWEALKEYHDRYYHPSNCIAFLYGRFDDYTAFLKLLNEAFSPYEKRGFVFEDPDYVPLTESVECSLPFAAETSASTENHSTIYYTVICPGLNRERKDELLLNTLTDLLAADASPLMQSLKKALPAGSFSMFIETETPEDAIVFRASNVNPEDAAVFRRTVEDGLAELAESGFSQELVDGVNASLSLSTKLISESSSVGISLIPTLAYGYASSGLPFDYMDYVDALDCLDEWNRQGLYQQVIRDWLLGDVISALVSTYPEPGLKEEQDVAEKARLAELKAAMTDEELQVIIDSTNAVKEAEDTSAYVAMLQAVTVDSLPEEQRGYEVMDETGEDGIRRLSVEANVDGIGQTMILLDAAGIPQDALHWFNLYTALLGEMDTAEHSKEELATLTTRYLYNGSIHLALLDHYDSEEYHPYLRAGWTAADDDLDEGYDLIYELLYDTQFTDYDTLLGLIQHEEADLKSSITASPYSALLYREFGAFEPINAYYDYVTMLEYYVFLQETVEQMKSSPKAVQDALEEIQRYFHNSSNAVSAYAGGTSGIRINSVAADRFLAKLDCAPVETVQYFFEQPTGSEALILESNVQYNGIVSDYRTVGLEHYTADLDAVSTLVTDLYLIPMLREQYGVYSPMHAFLTDAGPYFISYRDPNITETFDVYAELPDFLKELEIDQETVNGYILSSYSYYAMPEGELSGALNAMTAVLCGEPEDLKLQYMRELKTLTPEKLKEYAETYAALMEKGIAFTVGGASAINANSEFYDVIMNPFGAVDVTAVEMTDVTEDNEHYEAVRYVYENRLMAMMGETEFGVEESAAIGDLAGVLYSILGGDASEQDEAVEFLAGYGLLPEGFAAEDPLSEAGAMDILSAFSEALGLEYETVQVPSEKTLSRGELAEIIMVYTDSLM
ncbi:MAG: insulinase family protein [Oscillospiraceae bacterium]|nr:insulinase family protein [Oscillospiraceae bacterium]